MKVFKTLLLAVATIALFAACKPKEEAVRVGLDSTAPTFIDGSVNLILTLSGRSSTNVGVTLSVTGNIPSESLTFEKNPSVAAGAVSATVPVTVNPATLEPGNYQATFTITHVDGADINVAKQSVTVELAVEGAPTPTVSFSSYSEAFDDAGKAKAKIALSAAAEEDVTVNFEVVTDYKDYNALPAEVLTFTNPVTIPAGTLEKEVEIVVDKTTLANGVTYYAIISIASVSENAKVAPSMNIAYIEATKAITANLRSDWTVAYGGPMDKDGVIYDVISASGLGENDSYYLFVYSEGAVAESFPEGGITEYLQYMEEKAIAPNLGTDNAEPIKKGSTNWLYYRLSVGSYEIWLCGCTEAGHLTGDYATATFTITPSTEMQSAYDKWLGEWMLNGVTITINEESREDFTYTLVAGSYFIDLDLGWDGELNFYVTDPCTEKGGEGIFAYYPSEEAGYINIYSGSLAIGVAVANEDFTRATLISSNNGIEFTGIAAFTYSGNSITGWGDLDIEFPAVLARSVAEESPVKSAAYSDFVGNWELNGVAITISEKEAGATYTLSGLPTTNPFDGEGLPEAVFDSTDGTFYIMEQKTGEWTYANYGYGEYYISGTYDNKYPEFPAWSTWGHSDPLKICTAQMHESGNVTFRGEFCEKNSKDEDMYFTGLLSCWQITDSSNENYGRGNWSGDVMNFQGTMTPATAATSAPARCSFGAKSFGHHVAIKKARHFRMVGGQSNTVRTIR